VDRWLFSDDIRTASQPSRRAPHGSAAPNAVRALDKLPKDWNWFCHSTKIQAAAVAVVPPAPSTVLLLGRN